MRPEAPTGYILASRGLSASGGAVKFEVLCKAGELAEDPVGALQKLHELAKRDGADSDWLEKAVRSAGATQLSVEVSQDPRYPLVGDIVLQALGAYDRSVESLTHALKAKLLEAGVEPDELEVELARLLGGL